jgi:hypothetical protein
VIGGNGGHFWIQHPIKHKVYQKYSMLLKKKLFLQACVIINLSRIILEYCHKVGQSISLKSLLIYSSLSSHSMLYKVETEKQK